MQIKSRGNVQVAWYYKRYHPYDPEFAIRKISGIIARLLIKTVKSGMLKVKSKMHKDLEKYRF